MTKKPSGRARRRPERRSPRIARATLGREQKRGERVKRMVLFLKIMRRLLIWRWIFFKNILISLLFLLRQSKVWHRLCLIKQMVELCLVWGLGEGNIFFWQDRWVNGQSLDSLLNTSSICNVKVKDFFNAFGWDLEKLSSILPQSIVFHIQKIPINITSRDILLCSFTNDGDDNICPHASFYTIRSIKDNMAVINCSFSSIFDVGNTPARELALLGAGWDNIVELSFNHLPVPIKGLVSFRPFQHILCGDLLLGAFCELFEQ
ncbi:hypothetical protein KFK09_017790 [Dendrobium nobile]|uniref:Uncharacterized protein n=1 Tax=Dendrobium nobile TaxID=94219 RepID=A0A8T3AU48_DENNO|nr:hypothetical protein KFK09_017790 [Dendrobium nobile]